MRRRARLGASHRVFCGPTLEDDRAIKEFGFGLGVAILIDAFIVRLTLVPAVMHIFNNTAWYIPRWVDRLMSGITIESDATHVYAQKPRSDAADEPRQRVAGDSLTRRVVAAVEEPRAEGGFFTHVARHDHSNGAWCNPCPLLREPGERIVARRTDHGPRSEQR